MKVIFVEDASTDSNGEIIKEFSDKYENVKSVYLIENSVFVGEPKNVRIENASIIYLMFLYSMIQSTETYSRN